jgi:hypothetical protein
MRTALHSKSVPGPKKSAGAARPAPFPGLYASCGAFLSGFTARAWCMNKINRDAGRTVITAMFRQGGR